MPLRFDTSRWGTLPSVDFRAVRRVLGTSMVRVLQSGRSLWPVRSGRSKRGFGYRVDRERVILTNTQHYSVYVEAGHPARRTRHSARRTLRAARGRILDDVTDEIQGQLDG